MNILLWFLQVALALHTAVGAVWKFSHTAEQTMPSLKAIPPGVWTSMGALEIILSLCLFAPAMMKSLSITAPIAAVLIAAEMLIFCGIHLASGNTSYGPIVYWMIVAAVAALVAYGRFAIRPF